MTLLGTMYIWHTLILWSLIEEPALSTTTILIMNFGDSHSSYYIGILKCMVSYATKIVLVILVVI